MICPECKKEYSVLVDKIDSACIVFWGMCVVCLNKEENNEQDADNRRNRNQSQRRR